MTCLTTHKDFLESLSLGNPSLLCVTQRSWVSEIKGGKEQSIADEELKKDGPDKTRVVA
jgi:hypothetical protein